MAYGTIGNNSTSLPFGLTQNDFIVRFEIASENIQHPLTHTGVWSLPFISIETATLKWPRSIDTFIRTATIRLVTFICIWTVVKENENDNNNDNNNDIMTMTITIIIKNTRKETMVNIKRIYNQNEDNKNWHVMYIFQKQPCNIQAIVLIHVFVHSFQSYVYRNWILTKKTSILIRKYFMTWEQATLMLPVQTWHNDNMIIWCRMIAQWIGYTLLVLLL